MAKTTPADLRLSAFTLATLPLLERLRRQRAASLPETCLERARHITTYLRDLADPVEPGMLTYAKAVRCYLTNKAPRFFDANLLAGTTTSKPWGAPVYPEWLGVTLWPGTLDRRAGSPRPLSPSEMRELDQAIFPFWRERRSLEATRARVGNAHAKDLMFRIVRFIGTRAETLSHPEPCATVVLEQGLAWVLQEAGAKEAALRRGPEEDLEAITFYQAIQEVLQGLLAYAGNLGRFAVLLAVGEPDPQRRQHLADMAEVCAQVPAGPARNFREAVNALWLLQVGLYAGSIDPALSPGRWDQILTPMYRQDLEAGVLTPREAMDLLGCLWLKLHDNTYGLSATMEELFGGLEGPREGLGNAAPKEDPVGMMGPHPDLPSLMRRVTELLTTQDLCVAGSGSREAGVQEASRGSAFRDCHPDGREVATGFEKIWNTFRVGRRLSTIS